MSTIAHSSTTITAGGRTGTTTTRRRGLTRALSAAAAVAGTAGLLSMGLAAGAHAAAPPLKDASALVCTLEVLSLEAHDLQENRDEIKIKLDETKFGPWDFNLGQFRSSSLNSPTKVFSGTIEVSIREVDAVTYTTINSFDTGCSYGEWVVELENNNTLYEMTYEIT